MSQFRCEICGIKDALTFRCNYCGGYFCTEHHLPESHNCPRIPKIAPFHARPLEVESYKPSLITSPPTHQHSKTKSWKKIAWVLPLVIIIGLSLWVAYPFIQQAAKNPSISSQTPTATPTFSIPNITSSTPAPITTPALTTSYVEVDYQIVGWFYGAGNGVSQGMQNSELPDPSYNYTYLVLNVTITNYGYSQVNAIGSDGFSAAINNNTYQPLLYSTSLSIWSALNNVNLSNNGSSSQLSDLLSLSLPNPATLLNTGIINGLVIFQFGNPNIYPQQPQILNEPFTLQYSVTYGVFETLSGPCATVVINQK